MTTTKRNTNTPGRMYDRISAQRSRATIKLDGAIARLRASHHGKFHAYVLNSIDACSDPDELRGMLARRAEKEQAQLPDPFWQVRGLLDFIGSAKPARIGPPLYVSADDALPHDLNAAMDALAATEPPDSAPPSVPDEVEPDEIPMRLRGDVIADRLASVPDEVPERLREPLSDQRLAVGRGR